MQEFRTDDRTISAYLAVPKQGSGSGVLVLHAWWGLTEPFRHICDQLAEAGFVAIAPDLYQGKTATTIEEAEALAGLLFQEKERAREDVAEAVQVLRQRVATNHGKLGVIGFSLGGAYALNLSIQKTEEIAAVVTFYCAYTGLDYHQAKASYLCHVAGNDAFDPPEAFVEMEQEIRAGGRPVTNYVYPGTAHWFFEENRPEYNAEAAYAAWERTIEFLHQQLD